MIKVLGAASALVLSLSLPSVVQAQGGQYGNSHPAAHGAGGTANQYGGQQFGNPGFGPQGGYGNQGFGPQGGYGGYMIPPAPAATPENIVREGLAKLKAFIMAGGAGNSDQAREFAEQEIAPYFDFPYMVKYSASRYWDEMSQEQKDAAAITIRDMFLASLAKNLGGYNNPDVIVHRARKADDGKEVSVAVSVRFGGSSSLRMSFRFYKSKTGWKVFDVQANGQSALVYYRKYFDQQMRAEKMKKMQQLQQQRQQMQRPGMGMPYGGQYGGYPGGHYGAYPGGGGYQGGYAPRY
ncbi:MAG: MlaC/ttg2D family ABC transporter substrate-binding protein [Gammaproteobacteria bacterium]